MTTPVTVAIIQVLEKAGKCLVTQEIQHEIRETIGQDVPIKALQAGCSSLACQERVSKVQVVHAGASRMAYKARVRVTPAVPPVGTPRRLGPEYGFLPGRGPVVYEAEVNEVW